MKNKKKKYAFKTLESYPSKDKYCHYSGLPSPNAYGKKDVNSNKEKNTDKNE